MREENRPHVRHHQRGEERGHEESEGVEQRERAKTRSAMIEQVRRQHRRSIGGRRSPLLPHEGWSLRLGRSVEGLHGRLQYTGAILPSRRILEKEAVNAVRLSLSIVFVAAALSAALTTGAQNSWT